MDSEKHLGKDNDDQVRTGGSGAEYMRGKHWKLETDKTKYSNHKTKIPQNTRITAISSYFFNVVWRYTSLLLRLFWIS